MQRHLKTNSENLGLESISVESSSRFIRIEQGEGLGDDLLLAYDWLRAAYARIDHILSLDNDDTELDLLKDLRRKLDVLSDEISDGNEDCIFRLRELAVEAGLYAGISESNLSMVECQLQILMQMVLRDK